MAHTIWVLNYEAMLTVNETFNACRCVVNISALPSHEPASQFWQQRLSSLSLALLQISLQVKSGNKQAMAGKWKEKKTRIVFLTTFTCFVPVVVHRRVNNCHISQPVNFRCRSKWALLSYSGYIVAAHLSRMVVSRHINGSQHRNNLYGVALYGKLLKSG